MRIISEEAMAVIATGNAVTGGAVAILCDPPVRAFSGQGVVTIGGEEFQGIDHAGLVVNTGGMLGAVAQSDTLQLSGVDPDTLALLDADDVRGAPVAMYRLVADPSGTALVDARVFRRGRIDRIETEEVAGGTAVVRVTIEGAARGLGRRGARLRSDADQRMIDPDDGGMRRLSFAGEKMLYWGGKMPARAGAALGGLASSIMGRTILSGGGVRVDR